MNYRKLLLLISILGISACAYQPTPYKVVQKENYEQGALAGLYKLGVTEERVSENIYIITVKLDSGSDPQRARNMLLLHASKLAKSNGYKFFKKSQMKVGGWCQKSRSSATKAVLFVDGGPSAKAKIAFIDLNEQTMTKKKKLFNAEKIIERLESLVSEIISNEEADINTDKRMRVCWNRR